MGIKGVTWRVKHGERGKGGEKEASLSQRSRETEA